MRLLHLLFVLWAISACRTGLDSSAVEAVAGTNSEPPEISPPPTDDENSSACDVSRLWKYADLSYKDPRDAAAMLKGDGNFPGAVILGRFVAAGSVGEAAPTYLVRDSTSCNLLISVRGTAGADDAGTDINFLGGRNDGLLAKLGPGVGHRGFVNALLGIDGSVGEGHWDGLLENRIDGETLLEKLDGAVKACNSPRGARILVTGHSLGGAVASLLHFILLDAKGYNSRLVTFGSPRPISTGALRAFTAAQAKQRWGKDLRVAGTNDAVTYVPPAYGGFTHIDGELLSVFRGGHTGATYGYADSTKFLCSNDVTQKRAQRGEGVALVTPGCLAVVLPPNLRGAQGPCMDAVAKHESLWYQVVSTTLSRYWTCGELLKDVRDASENPLWQTEWDKCQGKLVRCMNYMNDTCPFPTGTAVDGLKSCAMRGGELRSTKNCEGSVCAEGKPEPAVSYLNGVLWGERPDLIGCVNYRWRLKPR